MSKLNVRWSEIALKYQDVLINGASAISVVLLFLVGIGRYRFILVYAAYSLLNCSIAAVAPGKKIRFFLLPATIIAIYIDINKGPLLPLFPVNHLFLSLVLMLIVDGTVRKITNHFMEKVANGAMFVVCPSCNFDHSTLSRKCAQCSYENKSQKMISTANLQKNTLAPIKVIRMLNLNDNEEILYHFKLFPYRSILRNGIRQIRTNFVITTRNIYITDYFYFSRGWREKDIISLQDVVNVEGKMIKLHLSQEPILIMRTLAHDEYEIRFRKLGKFRDIIKELTAILKNENPNINVDLKFPSKEYFGNKF